MSAQPVRLYDSYGHPIATVDIGSGQYALASQTVNYSAYAFETLTVLDDAVKVLTAAVYDDSVKALITLEDNPIRVTWDGTTPDASTGHLLVAGAMIELDNATDIANFQAIAVVEHAIIDVTYSVEA